VEVVVGLARAHCRRLGPYLLACAGLCRQQGGPFRLGGW